MKSVQVFENLQLNQLFYQVLLCSYTEDLYYVQKNNGAFYLYHMLWINDHRY